MKVNFKEWLKEKGLEKEFWNNLKSENRQWDEDHLIPLKIGRKNYFEYAEEHLLLCDLIYASFNFLTAERDKWYKIAFEWEELVEENNLTYDDIEFGFDEGEKDLSYEKSVHI